MEVREHIVGLTDSEVKERVLEGKVNKIPKAPSRTLGQMIRANFLNIFNAINLVLSVLVIIAGSPKNAVFAIVIIVNSVIGVAQELSAKNTLEKLSVLSMAHATVIRNGKKQKVSIEELVIDDIVCLDSGQQILADCELIQSDELEVDESMLTGEADPVFKNQGDPLLSGSFVVAGEGVARVNKVGSHTYSSQLADEARKFKIVNSELQSTVNKIIKVLLFIIGPAGVALVITQLQAGNGWQDALIGAVSGIIGMLPEGLVLLISTTFIVSVIKLSKYDTLVQQLSATEILARVDVLCADKTGTITEGKLKLADIQCIGKFDKKQVDEVLATLVNNLPSKNPTQLAILEYYKEIPDIKVIQKVPFSSKRKWGGIVLEGYGSWIMGAPEIVLGDKYSKISAQVEAEAKKGRRVLVLAKANQEELKQGIESEVDEAALILIEDIIREEAPDVLRYFREQDVTLKVISGDNPVTVSAVAMRAGVENADKYVDARELPTDVEELKEVVDNYTVFGRVTPHQKKAIVQALQKNEHTVAMTGDGVNDVLALKESDCGIAMANGSDATKAVAQLVLLNSDFSSLPKVVAEGRKQINNIERVGQLYLSKTAFFVLLAFIICIKMVPYPLEAIQGSLVGACCIGMPSLVLANLPFKGRVKGNFAKKMLSASIPNGIIMAILVLISYFRMLSLGQSVEYSRSVALLVFVGISLGILMRVSWPFNKIKTLLFVTMVACCAICYMTPIGRRVFTIVPINFEHFLYSLILIGISLPVTHFLVRLIRKKLKLNS